MARAFREAAIATETELKLATQPRYLPALRRLLETRAGCSGRDMHLVSTYFDTPDGMLARQGLTLRVREQEGRFVQTVKSAGGGDGVALVRGEWEDPVPDARPDPWAPLTGRFIPERAAGDLAALVRTEITRWAVVLCPDAATCIEAASDQGQVTVLRGNAREPICEIELELKRGDIAALYDLALEMIAVAPLRLERDSKSARGFRLAGLPTDPRDADTVHAGEVELDPRMAAGAALQRITRSCIYQIVGNEAAVRAEMPEGVHQMRVGVRRLRALLSAFAPLLPEDRAVEYEQFANELHWLGNVLGQARNLDVFAEEIVAPAVEAIGDIPGLASLRAALAEQRAAAHADAVAAIGSPRYAALVLRLMRWSRADGREDRSSTALAQPLGRVAARLLKRRLRQVRRRGDGFSRQSAEERHRLRIALKKLRYSAEMLGRLYDADKTDRLVRIVKRLQQELGEANDLSVARHFVDGLAQDKADAAPIAQAGAAVLDCRERHLKPRERKTGKEVAEILDYPSFW